MFTTDVAIIGGGQAGLAMSRCLTRHGIDHVVLERGRIGQRWRAERWDSLRLLTPNWMTRLPGFRYDGPDPDGYMSVPEVVHLLERYAATFAPPVVGEATVRSVDPLAGGFAVRTSRGDWHASAVVVATGHCDVPFVPPCAASLPAGVHQVVPSHYRNPDHLPPGGVLVVGASATGIQLADEIHASGRPVTLAAGQHLRLPRRYRGRDILWWLDAMGVLDQHLEHVADPEASRRQPSLQLVGRDDGQTLDLPTLLARGVRIVGRLVGVDGGAAYFDDDLVATTAAADLKLAALRLRIDAFARTHASDGRGEAEPFVPSWPMAIDVPTRLHLRASGVRTVVWATGFRREYPWLRVPVLDRCGEIQHRGGVTPCPGLYVLGLNFLRHRKSSFIDGVGRDAEALGALIAARLGAEVTAA